MVLKENGIQKQNRREKNPIKPNEKLRGYGTKAELLYAQIIPSSFLENLKFTSF